MTRKYDVIIIGAGIGGLTAAAILTNNGKRVLVLEKNPIPGGYAVNFKRGDFEFDASLHLINHLDQRGGVSYNILGECGIKDIIQLVPPKYLYRSIFPDFDIRVPQCNIKSYADLLSKFFPKEKNGIKRLFETMSGIFYRVEGLGGSNISTSDFILYLQKTSQMLLDEFLESDKLKAIISQLWPYYGQPPSKLSAFYFSYSWHDYTHIGGYYPNGGGKSIANALVEVINKNKSELRFNNKVTHILTKNNTSYGVANENGDEFIGDKIISNIDARTTFYNLIGEKRLPTDFLNKIQNMEPSISAFIVYLGLNENFKLTNNEDYIIFMNPDYKPDDQYNAFLKNDFYNAPFSLTLYSNLSNDFHFNKKIIVTIMTLSEYTYWKNLSKVEYKIQKNKLTEILINRAEQIMPNLSLYIEKTVAATPLTMERYTGSYKGAIYGWSHLVSQSGPNRLKQMPPINNLYLLGAWTQPGSGIKGVMRSGMKIAKSILEEDI